MPPDQLPVEYVSSDIIRQEFNRHHIDEKVKSGQVIAFLKRNSHLSSPPEGEPYCTHSQIIYYYTQSGHLLSLLAVAHQYLRPDATIGGSGKPDPKRLYLPDKILAVRSSKVNSSNDP